MFDSTEGFNEEESRPTGSRGFMEWAERHPGLFLLGTLVVAAMLFIRPAVQSHDDRDGVADETPLFI